MCLQHAKEEEKNASAQSWPPLTVHSTLVRHDKTNHGLFFSKVQPPRRGEI
jgi:hypothetical protein